MRRTFFASLLVLTLAASAVAQTRRGSTPQRTGAGATPRIQRPSESVPLPVSDALLAVDLDKFFKEVLPRSLAGDAARLAQVNADVDQFKARTGLDARAFDRLIVGARIVKLDSGALKLDNVTAIARGTVNAASLGAAMRAAPGAAPVAEQTYGGKTVYVASINDQIKLFGLAKMHVRELAVAALDAETVALGELADVRAAIDVAAGRAAGADMRLLSFPKGAGDFVGFGGNLPAGTLAGVETGLPNVDRAITSIQGFYGTVGSTAAGAQFMTTLRAASAADAKQLFDTVNALRQIAPGLISMAGEKGRFAQNAVNSLKVTTKANEVQLRLEIPQADLASLLKAL
jgi:hypothetical protein